MPLKPLCWTAATCSLLTKSKGQAMCGFPFLGSTAFTFTTIMSSPDWTRVAGHFRLATGKELLWDLIICAFDYNNKIRQQNGHENNRFLLLKKGQCVVSGQYSPLAPSTAEKAGWRLLLPIRKIRNKCGVLQNKLSRCRVSQKLVT